MYILSMNMYEGNFDTIKLAFPGIYETQNQYSEMENGQLQC